jgi:hypothetical protein
MNSRANDLGGNKFERQIVVGKNRCTWLDL